MCCAKSLQLCPALCNSMACSLSGSSVHGILQEWVLEFLSCLFQGIFLTQGSNLSLLHYRWILYHLSYLIIPFYRGDSQLQQGSPTGIPNRDQAKISCIGCRFFTVWTTREAPFKKKMVFIKKSLKNKFKKWGT